MITGGAVRIGRAIACGLADHGANSIVHYRNSEAEARRLCDILQEKGVRAASLQADLSSEQACKDLLGHARDCFGRLDILINNASLFNKDTFPAVTAEKIFTEFWSNLIAPMLLIRYFGENAQRGKIINLLDRRITDHDTSCVPYLLSKKGLAECTRLAALEYAPAITVNGVAPGAVLPPPGKGKDYLLEHAGYIPLEHQCTEEEIALAVLFLLKSDALTGQIIYVDGGQHLLGHERIS